MMRKMIRVSLCLMALLMPFSKGICSAGKAGEDEANVTTYKVPPVETITQGERYTLQLHLNLKDPKNEYERHNAISAYVANMSGVIVDTIKMNRYTWMILERLNLYNPFINQKKEWFVETFHAALAADSTLTRLVLNRNQLVDDDFVSLAKALETNTKLQDLDLGYNALGSGAIESLKSSLAKNKTLYTLVLDGNKGLKEMDLASFITFLGESCPTLQHLSVQDIDFSEETLTKLAEVLPKSPLMLLSLGSDPDKSMPGAMQTMLRGAAPKTMTLFLDDKSK